MIRNSLEIEDQADQTSSVCGHGETCDERSGEKAPIDTLEGPRPGSAPVLLRAALPIILWTFILVGAPGFVTRLSDSHRAEQEDFAIYYLQGEALRENVNPYMADFRILAARYRLNTHGVTHGSDPPTFLIISRLLVGLPIHTAYWIWQAANLACLALALFLLFGPGSGLDPMWALTLAGFAMLYPPVIVHFWFGQSKLPLVLLLVLMMRWMGNQREALAGFALALAALLRIFPLAMAGYLVLQQRSRTFAYVIVGFLAGGLLTIAFIGLNNCISFFASLLFLTGNLWKRDVSVYLFVYRWTWAIYPYSSFGAEGARYGLLLAIDLLVLMATIRATLGFSANEDPEWRLFSLWIATAVFLQPVAWDYDLTLMLIPFGQMASAAARTRASHRSVAMALASYLLILHWAGANPVLSPKTNPILGMSLAESGFFAMLTAYVSIYWFAVDHPEFDAIAISASPGEIWRRIMGSTSASKCALQDIYG
jgi:hypothetical protein